VAYLKCFVPDSPSRKRNDMNHEHKLSGRGIGRLPAKTSLACYQ
jgi:hypothetical protein